MHFTQSVSNIPSGWFNMKKNKTVQSDLEIIIFAGLKDTVILNLKLIMTLRQQPVQQNTLYRHDIMPDLSQSVCLSAWRCRWEWLCHMSIRKIGQSQECVSNLHFLFLYVTMLPSVCRRCKILSLSQRRTKANSSVNNFLSPGEMMCDTSGTKQSGKATRSRLMSSTSMNRQSTTETYNSSFYCSEITCETTNMNRSDLLRCWYLWWEGALCRPDSHTHFICKSARCTPWHIFISFHLLLICFCVYVLLYVWVCVQGKLGLIKSVWTSYLGESKHLLVSHIKCALGNFMGVEAVSFFIN